MLNFDPERPPVAPVDAATLILVRDADGLEVFFVRRNARSPFLGGAVVFPGGKLDRSDFDVTRTNGIDARALGSDAFAEPLERAVALAVCACRESLEEAGILPVSAPLDDRDLRRVRELVDAKTSLDDALAGLSGSHGLDTKGLVPFARWVTPEAEARRFDARFFLAAAPLGQDGEVDHHEAVAAMWASPSRMLDAFHRGDVFLAPPTLRALELLADAANVNAAVALARQQDLRPIRPRFVAGDPPVLAIPGDPLHEDPTPRMAGGTRFVLRDGRFVSEWAPR
jgi:8-oxo-dGTP pyrophosphatase MutT (NUDIX family)